MYLAILVHNLAKDRACVGHTSAPYAEWAALASPARTLLPQDHVISVRTEVDYLACLQVSPNWVDMSDPSTAISIKAVSPK